jgi:hypothetical protein
MHTGTERYEVAENRQGRPETGSGRVGIGQAH